MVYHNLYIVCGKCGHRNRPHPSNRVTVEMALLGKLGNCKGRTCGKPLSVPNLRETPLVKRIKADLTSRGLLPNGEPNPAS